MISNGQAQFLYPGKDVAAELKEAGLYGIEVSANAENQDKYLRLCRPIVRVASSEIHTAVFNFAQQCQARGIETRVTLVTGFPSEMVSESDQPKVDDFLALARSLGLNTKVRKYG